MEDLIFISAQPENVYFYWQVSKHGIIKKSYKLIILNTKTIAKKFHIK